jgi:hypothetical protein
MIGTATEYYDFVLYSFIAAIVFGPLFFPTASPWLGTLAALSTHAVAFVLRPAGAAVFGRFGDRFGRRPALIASLALMGGATVGIGLLPTYATIGVAAPILLVVLRMLQGAAVGGEWGGAMVVAAEHSPANRRTLHAAFPQIGAMIGIGLAALSLLVVNTSVGVETFRSWGWRLPFLVSALLVVFGLVLRRRLDETPEYIAESNRIDLTRQNAGGIRTLLREARQPLAICILMWVGPVTFAYAFLTGLLAYVQSYAPSVPSSGIQLGLVLTSIVLVGVSILSAVRGNRWGRERTIVISGVWTVLWAAPSYWLISTSSLPLVWLSMMIGCVSYGLFNGVGPSVMAELFPVKVRYVGVAVGVSLSVLIGGAVLPLPSLALVGATGGSTTPMIVMMVISGAATIVGGTWAYRTRSSRLTWSTSAGDKTVSV